MHTSLDLAPVLAPLVPVADGSAVPLGRRATLPRVPRPLPAPAAATALDRVSCNRPMQVWRVDAAAAGQPQERARQLADIGFAPGERVVVLSRTWPGAGALVVLVGHSRFALRRAEAACILVRDIA